MRNGLGALCKARSVPHPQRGDATRLRIAVDATSLLATPTGVGRFTEGALRALAGRPELEVRAFAVSWRRRGALVPLVPAGVEVRQRPMPARPLQRAWAHLPGPAVEWFVGPADVVHGTNFVVPPTRRAARVVTVHDLTVLRFPELCDRPTLGFVHMIRRAISAGAWVHTHSRFVADEVVDAFGADAGRVRPVPPGVPSVPDTPHAPDERAEEGLKARGPASGGNAPHDSPLPGVTRYVLAVGTVEPRKDYPGLVRAFSRIAAAHRDVALVVAGADGWGAAEFHRAVDDVPFGERIVQLGYVSDADLARLLQSAALLAFPSVYEGFGFPPVEAMAHGVPVVATTAGSIPEVVGDAALLVAPRDVDALAAALDRLLSDEDERASLIERGHRRSQRFSWQACGSGLADLYADAAAGR